MITMISYDKILGCDSWRWVLPVLVKGLIFNIFFYCLLPPGSTFGSTCPPVFDLAPTFLIGCSLFFPGATFLFGAKISPVCSYLFQSSFWILFDPPGGEKLEQVDPKGGFKMETVKNFLNIFFRGLLPPLSLLKKWGRLQMAYKRHLILIICIEI